MAEIGRLFALTFRRGASGRGAQYRQSARSAFVTALCAVASLTTACTPAPTSTAASLEWTHWNGDAAGTRYSRARQIDRRNVARLKVAWMVHLGDCPQCPRRSWRFATTPLMVDGRVFTSTPLGRVVSLDPATGVQIWTYDAAVDRSVPYAEGFVTRGLAYWQGNRPDTTACSRSRVFATTVDARLISLDAASGEACRGFGRFGTISLAGGVSLSGGAGATDRYSVTSPPTVIGNLVVVGSTIDKTRTQGAESGVVRAYDAVTGGLVWQFDPIPRSHGHPASGSWDFRVAARTGGANAWAGITADSSRGLLFVPSSSAAPDYVGANRPGRNDFANSVVALEARSGRVKWAYQFVHHDLWDYDVAAAPLLATIRVRGDTVPVVIVGTKAGMVFALHRTSGRPVFAVEERAVPPSNVPNERAWPTQPFSRELPVLHDSELTGDMTFGITSEDREYCRAELGRLRNEGTFTPPSLAGSVTWPGVWGGINWDGLAWDPAQQVLVASIKRLATITQLHETSKPLPAVQEGAETFIQAGTPWAVQRRIFAAPSGVPCTAPPWGELLRLDFATAAIRWRRPLGVIPSLRSSRGSDKWGSLLFGAPLVTAGGLIFIAASQDDRFRAIDVSSGEVVWEHALPAGGQAGPLSYVYRGRQYVAIAAGGRSGLGSRGDWLVVFALP